MNVGDDRNLASESILGQLASKGKHAIGEIAHALSSGFDSIYYIDTENDHFVQFGSHGKLDDLQIESTGKNFFVEELDHLFSAVVEEDRKRVYSLMSKDALQTQLTDTVSFLMTYQVMDGQMPRLYTLKAARARTHDDHHIVIGVSDVDTEIDDGIMLDRQRIDGMTYARIARALAADYFNIYYVNIANDHFIECSTQTDSTGFGIESSGSDFFGAMHENIKRTVHPEDVEMVLGAFEKESMLADLRHDKTFSLTYRLLVDDKATYVRLKATRMEDETDDHIVIGINNADEQIKREQEYARALSMVNRDALTGVKSKHAYEEEQQAIDQAIAEGAVEPFAVAVCDINGLKHVNDTMGHNAGDRYIKSACRVICNVFKHSPVFRIGGDEFAVVLRGDDFAVRDQLMVQLDSGTYAAHDGEPVSIAGGLAVFDPQADNGFAAVFERADAAMYENKKRQKALRED